MLNSWLSMSFRSTIDTVSTIKSKLTYLLRISNFQSRFVGVRNQESGFRKIHVNGTLGFFLGIKWLLSFDFESNIQIPSWVSKLSWAEQQIRDRSSKSKTCKKVGNAMILLAFLQPWLSISFCLSFEWHCI